MSWRIQGSCGKLHWSCFQERNEHIPSRRSYGKLQREGRIVWNWWRINWVQMEFVQKILVSEGTWSNSDRSEPSSNKSRMIWGIILFISVFNGIDYIKNGNSLHCIVHFWQVKITWKDFDEDINHFSNLEMKKKWYWTYSHKSEGK